jgi:hypothetical protein
MRLRRRAGAAYPPQFTLALVRYANEALSFSFSRSRKLSPVGASRTNQSFQFSRTSKIALEGPQFIGLEVNGPKGRKE